MNRDEINTSIAELCGIKRIQSSVGPIWVGPGCNHLPTPPDYFTDLNATHEAEMCLNGDDWVKYFDWIQHHGKATGVRATAPERCEGILRVAGKWRAE